MFKMLAASILLGVMMQAEIKIEPVPKLDKALRVAFTAVKRDVHNLRGEFDHLEEKVHSSLDIFQNKLDSTSKSTEREVRERTKALEKLTKQSHTQLEKELAAIAKDTEQFIKKTNERIMQWNVKIRGISKTEKTVKDLEIELKQLQLLKADIEKIALLEKHIFRIESAVVGKDDFEKEIALVKKHIDKSIDKLNINIQIASEKQSGDLVKFQKEVETKIFTVDERVDKVIQSITKLDKLSHDKAFIKKSKQLETYVDAHAKHIEGLKQALKDQQTAAKKEHDEIRSLIGNVQSSILTKKDIDATIDIKIATVENDQKVFADAVQKQLAEIQKEIKKTLEDGNKAYQDQLKDQSKQDQARIKELEKHIGKLEKNLDKISKASTTSSKKSKEKAPKEEKEPKAPKGPSLWRRFVDFLVEDVEEDKDSKLQEFDRKKGDKFEIKELKEVK